MRSIRNHGFTLIELMVALAVLAILLMVGAPAFTDLIKENRLVSENYAMRATLNNARSEALAQRLPVTVCRSTTGDTCSNGPWGDGYIAFTDFDTDGIPDDPNSATGDLIFISRQTDTDVSIEYSGASDLLRFDSRGYALGVNGTFTFCDDRGAIKARGLIVGPTGSVKSSVDPSGSNGIKKDHAGADLACP